MAERQAEGVEQKESLVARLFRNPLVIGLALLGTIGAAFQVAGVTSMVLANIILAAGIWAFVTLEVWCSKWIKRSGGYAASVVLAASYGSGMAAIVLALTLSVLKKEQIVNSPVPTKVLPSVAMPIGPSADEIVDAIERRHPSASPPKARSHLHVITITGDFSKVTAMQAVGVGLINNGNLQADVMTNHFQSSVGPFPHSTNVELQVVVEVKLEDDFILEFEHLNPRPVRRDNALLNELPPAVPRLINNSDHVPAMKLDCFQGGDCGYWLVGRFDYFDHGSNIPRFISYCGVFHKGVFTFCHHHNEEP